MSTTEQHVVPPESTFRCAPWTQAQGVDPIGSTPRFDALVLVEWPLPWPSDVTEIPELADASMVAGVRVMLVVPRHDDSASGLSRVVHHRRLDASFFVGTDHQVPHHEVGALVAALAADPLSDAYRPSVVGVAPPEVLVCGHGKRDACCGRWGTLVHVELAARSSSVRVWRCSHTGGHRFAPTAITLPEGRAWAYIDADMLSGIVARTADPVALAAHDRGTSSLDAWAQVLERAVFSARGWAWLDQRDVTARTVVSDDGRRADVTLDWPGGTASGQVTITRTLPVLVCGEPPEAATKTSPEFTLSRFEIHGA
ncbi:MAG: sucrase ferredoxin [Acidimicrobiales bacterium]